MISVGQKFRQWGWCASAHSVWGLCSKTCLGRLKSSENPLQRCSLTRLASCLLSMQGPHRTPECAPNGAPGEVMQEAVSQADVSFL